MTDEPTFSATPIGPHGRWDENDTASGRLSPEDAYRYARLAVVMCGSPGEDNCRVEWNAEHPDDQVTEQEQREMYEGWGDPE